MSLESAKFEAYYKRQGICPTTEWADFLASLRTDLPAAIRVNPGARTTVRVLEQLRQLQVGADGATAVYAPRRLPWYPGGFAWQWDGLCSRDIRRDEQHRRLKAYLLWLQNHGAITRQETVSMIPPLCLDVKPGHMVLDLCAAPGSKASQILEMLHSQVPFSASEGGACGSSSWPPPGGALIANEISPRRAETLSHQLQRLCSPCTVVTQIDAQFWPNFVGADGEALLFDRVLADVPCTGDGTMRKFPEIWGKWVPRGGHNLHPMQLTILCRGLAQLKVGGRLVYSTCSFNPIEDEAVVAAALKKHAGSVRTVPFPELEGLHGSPGLLSWAVSHPDDAELCWERFEEVPEELRCVKPTFFPPAPGSKEADVWANSSKHCRRFLPHRVGSGGFFVVILERVAGDQNTVGPEARVLDADDVAVDFKAGSAGGVSDAAAEAPAPGPAPPAAPKAGSAAPGPCAGAAAADAAEEEAGLGASSPQHGAAAATSSGRRSKKEKRLRPISDFDCIDPEDQCWQAASTFFGLPPDVLTPYLVQRRSSAKKLFCVSPGVARFLFARAASAVRVVHAGVRAFEKLPGRGGAVPTLRVAQEALDLLVGAGLRRHVSVSSTVLAALLSRGELSLEELRQHLSDGQAWGFEGCHAAQAPVASGEARDAVEPVERSCPGAGGDAGASHSQQGGEATPKGASTLPRARDPLEGCLSGSVAVILGSPGEGTGGPPVLAEDVAEAQRAPVSSFLPPLAVAALLSRAGLQCYVPRVEAAALLESLDMDRHTEAILRGAVDVGQKGAPGDEAEEQEEEGPHEEAED